MWLDILKGVGAVAGAGAQFYTGKQQNKLQREMFDYQIEQNKLVEDKTNQAQSNLDTAISNVYSTDEEKKKKKTSTADLSLAYGTPSTEM